VTQVAEGLRMRQEDLLLRQAELAKQLAELKEELLETESTEMELLRQERRLITTRARTEQELHKEVEAAKERQEIAAERCDILAAAAKVSKAVEGELVARALAVEDAKTSLSKLGPQREAAMASCVEADRARLCALQDLCDSWHEIIWGPAVVALNSPARISLLCGAHALAAESICDALGLAEDVMDALAAKPRKGILDKMFGLGDSAQSGNSADGNFVEQVKATLPQYQALRQRCDENLRRLHNLYSVQGSDHSMPEGAVSTMLEALACGFGEKPEVSALPENVTSVSG